MYITQPITSCICLFSHTYVPNFLRISSVYTRGHPREASTYTCTRTCARASAVLSPQVPRRTEP